MNQSVTKYLFKMKKNIGLSKYNAGSWGPSSSDLLIAAHNAKWNNEEE